MNDSEIINGLQRMSNEDPDGFSSVVLDLIKRQQAEIERLTAIVETAIESTELSADFFGKKAVREFAEKLKKLAMAEKICVEQGRYVNVSYVNVCDIERIVKEMTEEQNV